MKPPTLYRGDSIPTEVKALADPNHRGRTFAEHYYRNGLMAKFADGGQGRYLQQGLPYLVAAHIGWENNTPEERVSKHSPLISFSTELQHAGYFSDRTQSQALETCEIEQATHFIWRLALPELPPTSLRGVYLLNYKASTRNVARFRDAQVQRVHEGDPRSIISAVLSQIVHSNIEGDKSVHTALVIEPQTFLSSLSEGAVDGALVSRALARAKRWAEWLIYPTDPMDDGRGFCARFTLNEYLDIDSWARNRSYVDAQESLP